MRVSGLRVAHFLCAVVLVFIPLFQDKSAYAASAPESKLKAVTLQLKWKHQFQFAGYYAALENGYYRDVGLDVTISEAKDNQKPSDQVLSGQAEFGIAMSDLALLLAEHQPVVALAAIYQHSPLVFLTSELSNIDSLHDIAGKRIALEEHSAELMAYLESERIPSNTLRIVPHEFSVEKLLSGEVDAISAYSTDEPFSLLEQNLNYTIFSPRAAGIDFYGDTLFTTADFIATHPEEVKHFREASIRGWKYALENVEEIVDLILTKYSDRHSRDHLIFEAEQSKRLIMSQVIEIGYLNPGRWEHIIGIYRDLGMIQGDVDLDGFLYNQDSRINQGKFQRIISFLSILVMVITFAAILLIRVNRKLQYEIAERKIAEANLRQSEENHRNIVENATNLFYSHTVDHEITYISPQSLELLQCPPEEAMKRWTEFATDHPINQIGIQNTERAIQTKQQQPPYELELIGLQGRKRMVEVREKPLLKNGEVVAMLGSLTDITDRKEAERIITESESRYRALFDNNPIQTIVVDAQGKVTMFNQGLKASEYELPEIGHRLFKDSFSEFEINLFDQLQRCLADGKSISFPGLKYRASVIDMQITVFVGGAIITLNDVTEQRRFQDLLEQIKKMKAVGTLSGGIAHEFNNILSIIMGNAELAMEHFHAQNDAVSFINEIKMASIRGKKIVSQLLSFSHKKDHKKKPLDLKEILMEGISFLRASIPATISFNEEISSEIRPILGDRTEIHQVLINLASNATHAMEGDIGTLTFGLEEISLEREVITSTDVQKPGSYVRLSVSDTGKGIHPSIVEQVFDPFFTTKPVNKGSGMGLSIVYGIIKGHDAYIHLQSDEKVGTTVYCDFPVTDKEISKESLPDRGLPKGNETIMIVDDERSIVKLLSLQIKRLGYSVDAFQDAQTALDTFKKNPEKYNLIISDLAMPNIEGSDLVNQMKQLNPHLKTIVCSGLTCRIEEQSVNMISVDCVMTKPVEIETLAIKIRELLD